MRKGLDSLHVVFGMGLLALLAVALLRRTGGVLRIQGKYTFGIDVSEYQGKIHWERVVEDRRGISFVFIRATMGIDGKDAKFERNWDGARRVNLIRGAYHYYRPNENSTEQFRNFSETVQVDSGDLSIVLDVEEYSNYGKDNLRKGVLNWLRLAEEHYGVKPIIYTSREFYKDLLHGLVDEHLLWIASYSRQPNELDWTFHQISDRVRIKGIRGRVDGNDFRGSREALLSLTVGAAAEEEIVAQLAP